MVLDVLVIGAGFSGITAIDRLRKIGLKVKAFESGTGFGGVWYWNRSTRFDSITRTMLMRIVKQIPRCPC